MDPVVCMITDRGRLGQQAAAALIRRVAIAARAGVHLVQIRERDLADGALLPLVAQAVQAVRGTRTRILVNDRIDVAIAAGAHGVHLRSDSPPAMRMRSVAPAAFLIGRSVHRDDEAARVCQEGGLDYLLFGTVFETPSKPGLAPTGIRGLAGAVHASGRLPVLAIGGVTLETVGQLAPSGCSGFAAIGQFADCPEEQLAAAVAAARSAWQNPR